MNVFKKALRVSVIFLFISLAAASVAQAQLQNLPENPAAARFVLTDRVWPLNHGEAAVCLWEDDKLAAISITIDDNNLPEHQWWMGLGERYNWKFTWFVIVNPFMYNYDYTAGSNQGYFGTEADFRLLYEAGHDVQAHGITPINELSLAEYEYDLVFTKNLLQDYIPGNRVLCYAYPSGEYDNGKDGVTAQHFISARTTIGLPNQVNRSWYLGVRSGVLNAEQLDGLFNPGGHFFRGWMNPLYHLVGRGSDPVEKRALQLKVEHEFDHVKSHEKKLWVGLFREQSQYGQERDTHSLQMELVTATEIRFSLSDQMSDLLFDYPLTVKLRIDNSWDGLSALQNGLPLEAELILHEGNKYALIKAVPDRGQVVLHNQAPLSATAPIISPDYTQYQYLFEGNFINSVTVSMYTTTNDSTLYYTLDGSQPDENSLLYNGPFEVNRNTTLQARAYRAGLQPGAISTAEFRVDNDLNLASPAISPDSGSYSGPLEVRLTAPDPDALIYYTLDGSQPTDFDTLYSAPFYLSSNSVLNAICYKSGLSSSSVSSATYTIYLNESALTILGVKPESDTILHIQFDEPVDPATSSNPFNYQISGGILTQTAIPAADNLSVRLTLTNLAPNTPYLITLSGLSDFSGNRILQASYAFTHTLIQPEEGLLGYWKFDEGSGTTTGDSSGFEHTGSLNGAAWSGDSYTGSALYFDGNAQVDLGNDTFGIRQSNSFTLCMWFKIEAANGGFLIRRGAYGYPFFIETTSRNSLIGFVRIGSSNRLSSITSIKVDTWYHVAFSYTSGSRTLYLNGQADNSDTQAGTLNLGESTTNHTTLLGETFNGWIDEVKIYNRVLSPTEIQAVYTNSLAPTPAPARVLGDVNGDEIVTIVDALMTAQYAVGIIPAGFISARADVNCDGILNIVDALMIAQHYVGILATFPCGLK